MRLLQREWQPKRGQRCGGAFLEHERQCQHRQRLRGAFLHHERFQQHGQRLQGALHNTTGNANIALGYQAGYNLTSGSSNIDIGNPGLATDTNIIRIGSGQTQTFIAGTLNANGAGLTNLNLANFSGLLPGSSIDDGGSSTYQGFLNAVQPVGGDSSVAFASLAPGVVINGGTPSFAFTLNGSTYAGLGFSGNEAISQPYAYEIEVFSSGAPLDPDAQLGLNGSLTYTRNGRTTGFGGIVTACTLSASNTASLLYTFRLESPLANMALTTDYQINQGKTAPAVAALWGGGGGGI